MHFVRLFVFVRSGCLCLITIWNIRHPSWDLGIFWITNPCVYTGKPLVPDYSPTYKPDTLLIEIYYDMLEVRVNDTGHLINWATSTPAFRKVVVCHISGVFRCISYSIYFNITGLYYQTLISGVHVIHFFYI